MKDFNKPKPKPVVQEEKKPIIVEEQKVELGKNSKPDDFIVEETRTQKKERKMAEQ